MISSGSFVFKLSDLALMDWVKAGQPVHSTALKTIGGDVERIYNEV